MATLSSTSSHKQQEKYGSCPSSSLVPNETKSKMTTRSNRSRNLKQPGGALRLLSAAVMVLLVASIAMYGGSHRQTPFADRFLSIKPRKSSSQELPRQTKQKEQHQQQQQQHLPNALRKLDANADDPNVLNIHIVPHTHDDVRWLKTVEQYYYGLNMSIQDACVQDIIDTVVDALLESPTRTFTYVESKFFSMWWYEQNDATKDAVRYLIANKQLSFVNGGWCMHDEAGTHYMGMIDQTTLGHEFLKQELGVIPKVGWQLDPFGHSATQASLLTAQVGFDALYFGRIDYQDLEIRHATQECEGLWAASKAKGDEETIFWGLTGGYSGNYESPHGFCFDKRCHDPLLTNMTRTELVKKVNQFLQEIKVQSDRTKGNHIMLTMGSDFNVNTDYCLCRLLIYLFELQKHFLELLTFKNGYIATFSSAKLSTNVRVCTFPTLIC